MATDLGELRRRAERVKERHTTASSRLTEEKAALIKAEENFYHTERAQLLLQQVAQTVQQQAHTRIASVVSHCLRAVFAEEPYELRITFERKRGKTEARLSFVRDGREMSPLGASGGGAVDVASFALRLACLTLTRPPLRRLLVLDEPFGNVHGDGNRARVRQLMETLPRELKVQVIMVTGLEWLHCGDVVTLEK